MPIKHDPFGRPYWEWDKTEEKKMREFKVGQKVFMTLPVEIVAIDDNSQAEYKVETKRLTGCCMLPATFWCYTDELCKTGEER
jgi:hypothetical protein